MTTIHPIPDRQNVRLGSLDWSHATWRESFYPANMPEEWQLTYFNTQFNCVFLPRATWQMVSPEQWTQWHVDTHDQFLFLLESEASDSLPEALASKAMLIQHDDASILWFSRDSSLKELAAALSGRATSLPCYLISRDADLGQMERVATLLEVMGLTA